MTNQQQKYKTPYPKHVLTLSHLLESLAKSCPEDRFLMIADDHHTADTSRRHFRHLKTAALPGFNSTLLENIIDTVYFGPSDQSRLLQAVDLATFFFNRKSTIEESDKRSAKAVDEVVERIGEITISEYIFLKHYASAR